MTLLSDQRTDLIDLCLDMSQNCKEFRPKSYQISNDRFHHFWKKHPCHPHHLLQLPFYRFYPLYTKHPFDEDFQHIPMMLTCHLSSVTSQRLTVPSWPFKSDCDLKPARQMHVALGDLSWGFCWAKNTKPFRKNHKAIVWGEKSQLGIFGMPLFFWGRFLSMWSLSNNLYRIREH